MNELEVVLASGVAESELAARNATVSRCLQRLFRREMSALVH